MSRAPTQTPNFQSLPAKVERTLLDCAQRVLASLAEEEALLRASLQSGALYPDLFPPGSEEQARLDELVRALQPIDDGHDVRLQPDATVVREEGEARRLAQDSTELTKDLRALRLAHEARAALAAAGAWHETLRANIEAWGGAPENVDAFAGTFPLLDLTPQHPLVFQGAGPLVQNMSFQVEEAYNGKTPPSGFPSLDEVTTGLRAGHLWSVESSEAPDVQRFLRQLAYSAAESGAAVAYLSREATYSSWCDHMVHLAGAPDLIPIFRDEVQSHEWIPLVQGASTLAELPLHFASAPEWLPADFLRGLQALRSMSPMRLIVIEGSGRAPSWRQAEGIRWLRELAFAHRWTVVYGTSLPGALPRSPALWDVRLRLKRAALSTSSPGNLVPDVQVEVVHGPGGTSGSLTLRRSERGGFVEVGEASLEEREIEAQFRRGYLDDGD